ncbi:antirestriction protein ArdA [Streptomyces sp. NBRC 110465]|uniref:antirestriction protein ArdA n=1 Tax=Streptomyces sp. NBRC 110465 TaxID=1897621 RepID=UPI000933C923|nr:antirestriction protein ArdA [Streptomyces sp. NBRC 110465]
MNAIYVASLSDYNAGRHHGKWIEVHGDAGDVYDQIEAVLKTSSQESAEEYAIHDFEGFGGIELRETESIEDLVFIAEALDHYPAEVVKYFHEKVSAEDLAEKCQEGYIRTTEWNVDPESAVAEYALDYLADGIEGVPQLWRDHIEAVAQSLAVNWINDGAVIPIYAGAGTYHLVRGC